MISLTKRILIIFIFLCIFAWIAADILNFLRDGNETLFTNINNTKYMSSKEKFSNPGSGLKGLHVFSQISDLHISRFYDEQRVPDLRVFCTEVVGIIKPEVVIVSGDLTDAKTYDRVGSRQYEDEWQEYNNLLKETNIAQKTKWLDLRGNHDVFDVLSTGSENNFFSRYSIQGKINSKSYKYKHQTDDGNVFSFIAVDGCLEPGPKRPFNFFGQITEETLASLYSFSIDTANDTMTFWFGHYPTSTLVSPTPGIRELIGRVGSVYMCGHLHTLLGAAPTMYVRHQLGNLELEVGDWKDNRIFRVFAVDQGLFSFTDVTFNEWPIILITNPKDARFLMPTHEPTDHIKLFSHIRILVFSVEPIVSVDVWIDESYVGAAQQSEGDLYTLPWIPTNYLSGMHTITVNVKDTSQSTHNVTQPFSLDNTLVPFHWWYKFLLMSQFSYILKLFLVFGLLVNIVPLLTMRYLGYRFTMPSSESSVLSSFIQLWLYRLYLISHSSLYYPLVLFAIYIAVGPWFVGEVIQGNIGWCFSFGLYTAGRLIPASTIYSYAFIQYITFNLPLMLVLARVVELKSHPIIVDLSRGQQVQVWFSRHAPVVMLGIFQLYMSITGTFAAYGTMATLVNPVRTWSVPFAFVLHYVACKRSLSKTVYWTVRDHDNGISRDTRL